MGDRNNTEDSIVRPEGGSSPQETTDQQRENNSTDASVVETNEDSNSGRGQKRSLDDADNENDNDDEKNGNKYELPSNVQVTWEGDDATIAIDISGGGQQESRICIVGRARLRCEKGSLQVLGYSMECVDGDATKDVLLTSPYWSSWTTIQASATETRFKLVSVRGSPSFRLASPSRRPTVIPNSWISTGDQIVSDCSATPAAQRESLESDAVYLHEKPQIVLVCGGKGVGKSTFLRYMTNRLITSSAQSSDSIQEVAILDADVGQPELVPPGILSLSIQKNPLLQPPYWNLTQPVETVSSIFFGAFSSKVDPTRYIEAIQVLVQEYRNYLQTTNNSTPLIINMDGWIKGLGYEILTALILKIMPTHVCQILGSSKGKTFDLQNILSGKESTIYFLDACTNLIPMSCSIPSFTLRSLRLGTYFGPQLSQLWDALDFTPAKQLQVGWVDDECCLADYLASERPYCVPLEAVTCSFVTLDQQDLGTEALLLQAMNGSIVGLCIGDANNCLGLGLVRSIDWQRRLLYILTPVQPDALPQVDALIGGSIPLPLSMVFRGVYAESFPYQSMSQYSSTALGTDPMKSRNNIGRKGNMANAAN